MFQFSGFATVPYVFRYGFSASAERVAPFGNPRITAWLTAPRGLSQPPTSFIGSWCLGIHRLPLVACYFTTKMLASTVQFSTFGRTSFRITAWPKNGWFSVKGPGRDLSILARRNIRSLRTQQRAEATLRRASSFPAPKSCTHCGLSAWSPTGRCSTLLSNPRETCALDGALCAPQCTRCSLERR